MPVCIYCLEDKPREAFSKEHVLPQAFGKFRDGLTLVEVVCGACNKYFGDELDLFLGRDTVDGFNRFRFGLKPAKDYKSLGRASTMTYRIGDGPLAGALLYHRNVDDQLHSTPFPQVGFAESPEGPFTWFHLSELPSKEDVFALFRPWANLSSLSRCSRQRDRGGETPHSRVRRG